jgi:dipeptidyl aminopeptidase/acylaminoacyl peptidase
VGTATSGRGFFDAAGRVLIWAAPAEQRRELRWFDLDGRAIGQIGEPADYWQVRLSPDERTVAVTVVDPLLRTLDVATLPVTGGAVTRVSLAVAADSDPVWSPDGRRMAFRSWQDGQPHLYTRRLDATTGPDEPLSLSPFDEIPTDWKQDQLVFHARGKDGGFDVWGLRTAGGPPTSLAHTGFNEVDGRVSPDGQWLAYSSDESGQWDVYLGALSQGKQRTRVSMAGGSQPQWTGDGRALFFLRGRELMRAGLSFESGVAVVATPTRLLVLPPETRDYAVSSDGQRVLAIVPSPSASVLVMHAVIDWGHFPALAGPGR